MDSMNQVSTLFGSGHNLLHSRLLGFHPLDSHLHWNDQCQFCQDSQGFQLFWFNFSGWFLGRIVDILRVSRYLKSEVLCGPKYPQKFLIYKTKILLRLVDATGNNLPIGPWSNIDSENLLELLDKLDGSKKSGYCKMGLFVIKVSKY